MEHLGIKIIYKIAYDCFRAGKDCRPWQTGGESYCVQEGMETGAWEQTG